MHTYNRAQSASFVRTITTLQLNKCCLFGMFPLLLRTRSVLCVLIMYGNLRSHTYTHTHTHGRVVLDTRYCTCMCVCIVLTWIEGWGWKLKQQATLEVKEGNIDPWYSLLGLSTVIIVNASTKHNLYAYDPCITWWHSDKYSLPPELATLLQMSLFQLKTEKRVHDSNYTNCRVQALLFQAHHYWYISYTEDNVSRRVSAYSGAFSWRHNNRPAPTPRAACYTHWTNTSHLTAQQLERGLGTQWISLSSCLST